MQDVLFLISHKLGCLGNGILLQSERNNLRIKFLPHFSSSAHEIEYKHWSWHEDVQDTQYWMFQKLFSWYQHLCKITGETLVDQNTYFFSNAHEIGKHISLDVKIVQDSFFFFKFVGNCFTIIMAHYCSRTGNIWWIKILAHFPSSAHDISHVRARVYQ